MNQAIVQEPDLATVGAGEIVQKFGRLAIKKGVKLLTLLSGRTEQEAQEREAIIIRSGIDWTILLESGFFQNFSDFIKRTILEMGGEKIPVFPEGKRFQWQQNCLESAI